MKRRISKRRVKIILAQEYAKVKRLFQYEPKDDFTQYNIRTYMQKARDYWATAAYQKIH